MPNIVIRGGTGKDKAFPIDAGFDGVLREILYTAVSELGLDTVVAKLKITEADCNDRAYRYLVPFLYRPNKMQLIKANMRIERGLNHIVLVSCSKDQKNLLRCKKMTREDLAVPISYQHMLMGYLCIVMVDGVYNEGDLLIRLSMVASEIAQVIRRYDVRNRIIQNHNDSYYWVGKSLALRQLDSVVNKAANSTLPVLVTGQSGVGKILVAYAIHNQNQNESEKIIESRCSTWKSTDCAQTMQNLWRQARGGTLYLRGICMLDYQDFLSIQHYWYSRDDVRLIVSISPNDIQNISGGKSILSWLEFNCLKIDVPTLSERAHDIRDLVCFYTKTLERNCSLDFTEDAWALLEAYSWPGNVKQLERLLDKLKVIAPTNLVSVTMLLEHFPQIKKDTLKHKLISCEGNDRPDYKTSIGSISSVTDTRKNSAITFIEYFNPDEEHPALVKALNYIAQHYQKNFSMRDLSEIAFVSPSHLSYLFKQRFGRSFKQILNEVRIEKAQHLLKTMPARQITQICNDVGFLDLSHFEKTFKKYVGMTPRTFRNCHRRSLSMTK